MTTLTREQHALRGALIQESYQRNPGRGYLAAIQEGAQRFRQGKRPGQPAVPSIPAQVLTEAVTAALARHEDARKEAKRATRRRAAAEREVADRALVERMVAERLALARKFSEASAGPVLREASNADLAFVAAAALSGTGQPGPAARPVAEVAVDPRTLDLEDLPVAAMAGSAGSSAFWTGQTAGSSPFWRGLQNSGASKGTADNA